MRDAAGRPPLETLEQTDDDDEIESESESERNGVDRLPAADPPEQPLAICGLPPTNVFADQSRDICSRP